MSWIKNGITFLLSCLVTLLLVEGLLRFFPVLEVSRVKPLSSDNGAFDVSTVNNDVLVHSSEWDFKNAIERKTNNYGFFSDFDYQSGHTGVFVIGDSFVEARQVKFTQTFHQQVSMKLSVPVYNIGLSGAPLSQYNAYTDEVCNQFNPSNIIYSIIANDFDESLFEDRARSGFFHYHKDGSLQPTPYSINFLRKIANHSSLVRYLYFNLSLAARLKTAEQTDRSEVVLNAVHDEFQPVTQLFLDNLGKSCVDRSKITFVLDANRYESPNRTIYSQSPSRLKRMEYFKQSAIDQGFNVVDMQDVMLEHYHENSEHFEFSYDYHWNELGHYLVANEVVRSLAKQGY